MDLQKLLAQAQEMQSGLQSAQEKLATLTVEASGANGKVTATATASGDLTGLKIDPSLLDPDDAEFLSELVLKTTREALQKGRDLAEAEMKKHTGGLGGLGIPGL